MALAFRLPLSLRRLRTHSLWGELASLESPAEDEGGKGEKPASRSYSELLVFCATVALAKINIRASEVNI